VRVTLRFLFTNDDGVHADGLWALLERAMLVEDIEVFVVAPDRERSASGHAISIHSPIEVKRVPFKDPRFTIYGAGGTPADCVRLAIEGILDRPPDLVISGINRGPNLGTDVFYSGTVSAAMEGALLGVKSVAVSVAAFENVQYEAAADITLSLAEMAVRDDQWPRLVNVNVPSLTKERIAGVSVTFLGIQTYKDAFKKRVDPKGRCWYWLGGLAKESNDPEGSDTHAIKHNVISVTPLLTDLTDRSSLDILKSKSWLRSL
jgi:5'-nucleotidase